MSCIERVGYGKGRGIVVLFLLLFVCLPGRSLAQTYNNFNYTAAESAVTITGYTGPGGVVTIPSSIPGVGTVASIGNYAFQGRSGLTSITIPSSVTSIGSYAFGWCSGLTNITIPSSVTNISDGVLWACTNLTSINIPSSVTSIGSYAFYWCSGLTNVTIPSSVTNIGISAFSYCSGLTDIAVDAQNTQYSSVAGVLFNKNLTTLIAYPSGKGNSFSIPSSVASIGDYAFLGCGGLTSISIPSSVITIGGEAFEGCTNLTGIIIPNSVTSIGGYAFSLCARLTSITIPNSVTTIGDYAFYSCVDLTNVTISSSVTNIGTYTFYYCPVLTGIAVDAQNTQYSSAAGVLFNKNLTTLIRYPSRKWGSYSIPNSVISIGDGAFETCYDLTDVTIPNSVITIGDEAFYNCGNLNSVTIPNSVTRIGDAAFFYCSGLTNITISSSVTRIGDTAFYRCYSLTSVTIPSSVTSIGNAAFENCIGLTNVYFQGSAPTTFGWSVFDSAGPGFSIYHPSTAVGWTTPTWKGYPAQPYTLVGSLQISIAPADAISAGARWQVDGGTWQNSGTTISGLTVGNHTVGFKIVTGWAAPATQNIIITANQTSTATGVYVSEPVLPPSISISPATHLDFTFRLDCIGLVSNRTYQLQVSSNLCDWTNLGMPFVATSATNSQYLDRETDNRFFRLLYLP